MKIPMAKNFPDAAVLCLKEQGGFLHAEKTIFTQDSFLSEVYHGDHRDTSEDYVEMVVEGYDSECDSVDVAVTDRYLAPHLVLCSSEFQDDNSQFKETVMSESQEDCSPDNHKLLLIPSGHKIDILKKSEQLHHMQLNEQHLQFEVEPDEQKQPQLLVESPDPGGSKQIRPVLMVPSEQSEVDEVYVVNQSGGSVTLEMLHSADVTEVGNEDENSEAANMKFVSSDGDFFHLLEPSCYESCSTNSDPPTSTATKAKPRRTPSRKLFTCSVCQKTFTTNYSLVGHMRTHTKETPYHCTVEGCSKKFKMSGDLTKHIRSHTGERPFKCDVCWRGFTTSNILTIHKRVHTNERPYLCPEVNCGKRFASATNYKNHIRIHSGEKPFVCPQEGCGRRFTEYSSLYKHRVIHDESKKFQCGGCGKLYRHATTLKHHTESCSQPHQEQQRNVSLLAPAPVPRMNEDDLSFFVKQNNDWQFVGCNTVVRLLQVAAEAPLLVLQPDAGASLNTLQCIAEDDHH